MRNDNMLEKYSEELLDRQITVWVPSRYKEQYDKLSKEKRVRMAEMLRKVMLPEIERIWDMVFPEDKAA